METNAIRLPLSLKAAFVVLGILAVHVVLAQAYFWQNREDYLFGYLVPLFVLYVIWERKDALLALVSGRGHPDWATESGGEPEESAPRQSGEAPRGWTSFLLISAAWMGMVGGAMAFLIGAFVLGVMGTSGAGTFFLTSGFSLIVLCVLFLSTPGDIPNPKWQSEASWSQRLRYDTRVQVALLFLFPALIWLISAPLVDALERQVSLFLLNQVTAVVFFVFDMTMHPIQQHGNVLMLPSGPVHVAEACSGIRSLTACLFAGSFLAAVFLKSIWRKIALVGLAMLFAFFTNILRSLFLTATAYYKGPEAIEGAVHDITGYAVLGLTSLGLIALLPLFNLDLQKPLRDREAAEAKKDSENNSGDKDQA
ncbi:MAG: exosortase/archaeosortase family protein [Opitutales bacterium]|nr:exosortase/archaeosortase family protein [Opitutales bacterium]MCH8541317.1 exosortase/archaeosortase family protein [Opitutales bacterium]